MNKGFDNYQSNQNPATPTILQRIAQGDNHAAEECFDTYGKTIWGYCRKFTNRTEDAEDLVQEIFIDIWKNAANFDPAKSPEGAFIMLIVKRRLADTLRKHYRNRQLVSTEEIKVEPASNYHDKLQTKIEARSAVDALKMLKPLDNQLIRMSIFEGLSHEEIAQKISLPLGTVKTRIRRGIQAIQSSFRFSKNLPNIIH